MHPMIIIYFPLLHIPKAFFLYNAIPAGKNSLQPRSQAKNSRHRFVSSKTLTRQCDFLVTKSQSSKAFGSHFREEEITFCLKAAKRAIHSSADTLNLFGILVYRVVSSEVARAFRKGTLASGQPTLRQSALPRESWKAFRASRASCPAAEISYKLFPRARNELVLFVNIVARSALVSIPVFFFLFVCFSLFRFFAVRATSCVRTFNSGVR